MHAWGWIVDDSGFPKQGKGFSDGGLAQPEGRADQQGLEEVMKGRLRATIRRLEHDEAARLSAASQ